MPKGRRLYCSRPCYLTANRRQGAAARRERNAKRRAQLDIIGAAVLELHRLDPYHRWADRIDSFEVRWHWRDWSGKRWFAEDGKPRPKRPSA